ncbi:esterase/lipase family protein [Rhizobium leguminosarum]|uniref:esterase/lipase family protein n=1 Tax=Rhizobium leguminosarum TaxID=384 RepID=UPI003F97F996
MFQKISSIFKSEQKPTEIKRIAYPEFGKLNIVFVHGLNGDALKTWNFEVDNNSPSWKSWLLELDPQLRILSVGYRITSSRWGGGSMPIYDRAVNILASLERHLIDDRPILFVCHSYGGLLVKQMLRTSIDTEEYQGVAARTAAVVFMATPHGGSNLATYVDAFRRVYRSTEAITELKENAAALLDLNRWFRNKYSSLGIKALVFVEDMPTNGVLVVDAGSADPGINGITPIKIDADHTDLPRPTIEDVRVHRVKDLVKSVLEREAVRPLPLMGITPMQQVVAATDQELPMLLEKMKHKLMLHPEDFQLVTAVAAAERAVEHYKRRSGKLYCSAPPHRMESPKRVSFGWKFWIIGGALALLVGCAIVVLLDRLGL